MNLLNAIDANKTLCYSFAPAIVIISTGFNCLLKQFIQDYFISKYKYKILQNLILLSC
jgi:hypothetical protein